MNGIKSVFSNLKQSCTNICVSQHKKYYARFHNCFKYQNAIKFNHLSRKIFSTKYFLKNMFHLINFKNNILVIFSYMWIFFFLSDNKRVAFECVSRGFKKINNEFLFFFRNFFKFLIHIFIDEP